MRQNTATVCIGEVWLHLGDKLHHRVDQCAAVVDRDLVALQRPINQIFEALLVLVVRLNDTVLVRIILHSLLDYVRVGGDVNYHGVVGEVDDRFLHLVHHEFTVEVVALSPVPEVQRGVDRIIDVSSDDHAVAAVIGAHLRVVVEAVTLVHFLELWSCRQQPRLLLRRGVIGMS